MHLEIPKFDVAPIVILIRYHVTGVYKFYRVKYKIKHQLKITKVFLTSCFISSSLMLQSNTWQFSVMRSFFEDFGMTTNPDCTHHRIKS